MFQTKANAGSPATAQTPPDLASPTKDWSDIMSPSRPEAFFPALFEQGDAQLAMDRSIGEVFGGQPLDTATDISSVLRGLLASDLEKLGAGRQLNIRIFKIFKGLV